MISNPLSLSQNRENSLAFQRVKMAWHGASVNTNPETQNEI